MHTLSSANPNEIEYDYGHVPTVKEMSRDNSFIRSVIGPFGSGKSVGFGPIEIMKRAAAQEPHPDGIKRSRWGVIRNCYDDETEILTHDRGWKLFKDLAPDDEVAKLVDNNLVFEKPEGVAAHPYKGEMVGFESEGANFLVTPDHKMWVSKRRTRKKVWGEYEVDTAESIYGSQTVRVKRNAVWTGVNETGLNDDMFELLGFWFADGSYGVYSGTERITLTQCGIGIEYVRELLSRTGLNYSEWKRNGDGINFVLKIDSDESRKIRDLVCNAGKARVKEIPQAIMDSDSKSLKSFIDGFMEGDGCTWGNMRRIGTSSKTMADQLQIIALKSGFVANVSPGHDNTGRKIIINGEVKGQTNGPQYHVNLIKERKYQPILHVNKKTTNKLRGWYKEQYDGIVYCVEMELCPVYVRRRGKAFWCMRTYKQLEDTTINTFFRWLPPIYFGEYTKTDHNYKITAFKDMEIEIQFRALDRPEHVANVLSWEITGAFINEAREIPWALIGPLFGRCGRYPYKEDGIGATWRGLWMDSNAPPINHWLYRIHEKKNLTDHEMKMLKYWHTYNQPGAILADGSLNPEAENLENLPDDYYEIQASIMTEDQVKVYLRNEYGYLQKGKPVYPSWSDRQHKRRGIAPQDSAFTIIRGWDFGLTPACVLAYVSSSGQLRGFKEFTTERAGIGEFGDAVIKWCTQNLKDYKFDDWGDPSGDAGRDTSEDSGFQILEGKGVEIKGASNDMTIRLESVRYGLDNLIDGEPAMVMDEIGCPVLVEGFQGGYEYRRIIASGDERYSEAEPNKNKYSHPHDAWQYVAQIVFGDLVLYNQNTIEGIRAQHKQITEDTGGAWNEQDWIDDGFDDDMQTDQIT